MIMNHPSPDIPSYIEFPSAADAGIIADRDDNMNVECFTNNDIIEGDGVNHQDITLEDLQQMVFDIRRGSLTFANQCAISISPPQRSNYAQPVTLLQRRISQQSSDSSGLDLDFSRTSRMSNFDMASSLSSCPMTPAFCQECASPSSPPPPPLFFKMRKHVGLDLRQVAPLPLRSVSNTPSAA